MEKKPICSNCNDTGTEVIGGDMCANCNGCNTDVPDDLNLTTEPKDYQVENEMSRRLYSYSDTPGGQFQGRRWQVADDIAADDPNAIIH